LFDIAYRFYKEDGKLLIVDEIHKYKNFEAELKNIYDITNLQVLFSGSSALKIDNSKADLSRRAMMYEMSGLSFREFLNIKNNLNLKSYSFEEILKNHINIANELLMDFNLYTQWKEYLMYGYYPFYFENRDDYLIKLSQTINIVIESDIPSIFPIDYQNIINLKKLVSLVCKSNPYKPNMKNLLEKMNMKNDYSRLYKYLHYLDKGKILKTINQKNRGDNIFAKPQKLYLNNTNLHYSYCDEVEIGTIREVFFMSMFFNHKVEIPNRGDFLIDDKYLFEIGGKNKTKKQIKNQENSFVVIDNLEIGGERKIPLWLFGFLY
jgi:predicted AAA+ superfamily ATPase